MPHLVGVEACPQVFFSSPVFPDVIRGYSNAFLEVASLEKEFCGFLGVVRASIFLAPSQRGNPGERRAALLWK